MAKKNKNQIQYKKIKKNHLGFSALVLLGIVLLVIIFSVAIIEGIFTSSIDAKLLGEYQTINSLARIYEKAKADGQKDGYELLDASGRGYLLVDANGDLLHQNGDNTCTMNGGELWLYGEKIMVYEDSEKRVLDLSQEGRAYLLIMPILKNVYHQANEIGKQEELSYYVGQAFGSGLRGSLEDGNWDADEDEDEDAEEGAIYYSMYYVDEGEGLSEEKIQKLREQNRKMVSYAVWFPVSINGGAETLIGKAYFYFDLEDIAIISMWAGVAEAVGLILLVLLIFNRIRNILNKRKIIRLYLTDPITGGHNWMWFVLRGEPYLRFWRNAGKNFAIMEILFVKYRNYCICHSVQDGEMVLDKMYDIIKKSLTKKEMHAHVSSDCFAVLLQYQNEEELHERLRHLLESLENLDGTHKFAFHVGVNLLPARKNEKGRVLRRKQLNLETEYNNASTATASLDDSDESRIAYFDEKMVQEQKWLDEVTERQKEAIEREEFEVYYQPKYEPRTKKLCGAEALIRWNWPERGMISPGRFIPIFEKNGFITEIDHYMISHVARDQKAWLDQGLQCVPVSVNVSRAHFIEKDLASQICHMVDEAGAPHHLIEIELTESAFFDDKNAMINTIMKLKEYGFAVSMDDFGSGYSSLNSLKDMPLDVLKLDAEFFRGENAGERGEIVVSEAIKLARSLNMRTVAEGVEDKAQVKFLAENGCDMIQGFIFSKPLPREKYVDSMREVYSRLDISDEKSGGTGADQ